MERGFEYNPAEHESTLVEKLLRHEITGHDFLGKLLQEDQKTDMHEQALSNIAILESAEVANYFVEHAQERSRDDYHNLLSLSYFHAAQIQAVEKHIDATEYFEKAFIESEQMESEPFRDWRMYMFGTMKYLSEDIESMDLAINLIDNPVNRAALQRLKDGFLKYGTVDYGRDYPVKK